MSETTTATSRTTQRLPVLPAAAFVLVWSSGYIAGPAGVDAVSPFSLLFLRFVLAAVVLGAVALVLRRPTGMHRRTAARVALVGLVMNAFQFGLMYVAFDLGLPATLASMFHALSPVLTVLLAAAVLGERVRPVQVLGFFVGVVGVVLVLGPDVHEAGGVLAVGCGAASMLMLSLGTLGQRWIGEHPDPMWSATVQFAASAPPMLAIGLLTEGTHPVHDAAGAAVALVWLVLVNSIAGLLLLAALVRRGGAGVAGSLFFLAPPATAVMAWLVLHETLDRRELAGLLVCVAGVGAATWRRRAPVSDERRGS